MNNKAPDPAPQTPHGSGADPLTTVTKEQVLMGHATDQPHRQHTPTRARCTGDCTTTTQLPATGWTKDRWGWLCPTHTHARTDRPAVNA